MSDTLTNSSPIRKRQKQSLAQIDTGQSWDSVFELPLVKREFLPELVQAEVTKRYPRSIPADIPVFWTIIASIEQNGGTSLLCLASVPFNQPGQNIPAIHLACRVALGKTNGRKQWAALMVVEDSCRGVSVESGAATLLNLKTRDLPAWLKANAQGLDCYLFNPDVRGIPQDELSQSGANLAIENSAIVLNDELAAYGSWPAKPRVKRLGFIVPAALVVLLLGVTLVKNNLEQERLLSQQKTQIMALQKSLGGYQQINDEIKALEKELSGIPLPMTIGAYDILLEVSKAFQAGDKTLSIHYDGKNRTINMVCLSKNPIKLLKRISELKLLESVTSSGIIAWQQDPSYQKFQWSGVIRK